MFGSSEQFAPAASTAPSGILNSAEAHELLRTTQSELSKRLGEVLKQQPGMHRTPASYRFNVRFYGARSVEPSECFQAAREDFGSADALSLYLHYPFCEYVCRFCHYAVALRRAAGGLAVGSFLQKNLRLQLMRLPEAGRTRVSSVYFGGGTPSLATAGHRAKLVAEVRKTFDVGADCEWAIEANPETVTPGFLADLRLTGFNRLSIGVQVMDDGVLSRLGRGHNVEQVMEAVQLLEEGWDGVFNVDLMYGLPGVRPEKFLEDIGTFVSLGVPSITLYRLRLGRSDERRSALRQVYEKRPTSFPSQEETVAQVTAARRVLRESGYREGPIGWFVRAGAASQCYKDRWLKQRPLLGVGMSAYSYGRNWQFSQPRQLRSWVSALESDEIPLGNAFLLSEEESLARSVAFRLRYSGTLQSESGGTSGLPDRLRESLGRLSLCQAAEKKSWSLNELGLALIDEILDEYLLYAATEAKCRSWNRRPIAAGGMSGHQRRATP